MSTEFWYPLLVFCIVIGVMVAVAEIAEHIVGKATHRRLVWLACLVGVATAVPVFFLGIPFYAQAFFFSRLTPEHMGAAEVLDSHSGLGGDSLQVDYSSVPRGSGEYRGDAPSSVSLFPAGKVASDGVQKAADDGSSSQRTPDWNVLVFVSIWLAGIVGGLGWFGLQRWSIRKLLRTAEPVRNGALENWLVCQANGLGLRRRPRLIRCARIQTPVAFGVIQPTIGVPQGFPLEPLGIRSQAILLHELSHLAAGDPFWNALSTLIKTVLWWHPIVWFASLRLKRSCEEAADEATVLLPHGPQELAVGLVECARRRVQVRIPGLAVVRPSQSHSSLARRVRRLLLLEKKRHSIALPNHRKAIQKVVVAMTAAAVFVASLGLPFPEFFFVEGDVAMRRQHFVWRHSLIAAAIAAFAAPWGVQALAEEGPKPDRPREVVREERPDAPRERERAEREGESRQEEGERPRGVERERREEGRAPGGPAELERRMEELRRALREAEEAGQADRAEQTRQEIRRLEAELRRMRERRPEDKIPPEAREQMLERIERAMKETQERLRDAREAGREEMVRELERRLDHLERAMRDVREGRRPEMPFRLEGPPMAMREQAMERLQRAMSEVRERLQQARQAGREEEVRELEQQLGRMERQMAELREGRPPVPPPRPVAPERMERAQRAAELLRREGFGDMAEFLMRSLEREMRPVPPPEPGRFGPPGVPPRRPDRPEERPVERPDRPVER